MSFWCFESECINSWMSQILDPETNIIQKIWSNITIKYLIWFNLFVFNVDFLEPNWRWEELFRVSCHEVSSSPLTSSKKSTLNRTPQFLTKILPLVQFYSQLFFPSRTLEPEVKNLLTSSTRSTTSSRSTSVFRPSSTSRSWSQTFWRKHWFSLTE